MHGFMRRCPELIWDETTGRYMCLLMLDPEHGDAHRLEIGAGEGCCAPLNSWRKDVRHRG